MTSETIIHGFNALRAEQRQLSAKVHELETDLTEHKLVEDALQEMDSHRKCFRMIGGVLVERSVGEVLPSLQNNRKMIHSLIEALKQQILLKGQEIAAYVEKHQIQIRAQPNNDPNNDHSLTNSVLVQ